MSNDVPHTRLAALLARIEAADGLGRDAAEALRILSSQDADVGRAIKVLSQSAEHYASAEDREADRILRDAVKTLQGIARLIGYTGLTWPRVVSLCLAVALIYQIGVDRAAAGAEWLLTAITGTAR